MRILADENLEGAIVRWLRNEGHDVYWAADHKPGETDDALLRRAFEEERILITNDLDFGEYVFRRGLVTAGMLLLRFKNRFETQRLESLQKAWPVVQPQLTGCFIVMTEKRIRVRPLANT